MLIQIGLAQPPVERDITQNTIWYTGGTYVIDPDPEWVQTPNAITVYLGAILTIEPGVTVKFNSETYLIIKEGALLDVNGTAESEVLFTANSAPPVQPGFWGCIYFKGLATGNIDYCEIEYAGFDGGYHPDDGVGAVLSQGIGEDIPTITLTNSEIDTCAGWALWGYSWDIYQLTMEYCDIHHNDNGLYLYAIVDEGFAKVWHCNIHDNGTGLLLHGTQGMVVNNFFTNNNIGFWGQAFVEDYAWMRNNVMTENDTAIYFVDVSGVDHTVNNILVDNIVGVEARRNVGMVDIDYLCFYGNIDDFGVHARSGIGNVFADPQLAGGAAVDHPRNPHDLRRAGDRCDFPAGIDILGIGSQ